MQSKVVSRKSKFEVRSSTFVRPFDVRSRGVAKFGVAKFEVRSTFGVAKFGVAKFEVRSTFGVANVANVAKSQRREGSLLCAGWLVVLIVRV